MRIDRTAAAVASALLLALTVGAVPAPDAAAPEPREARFDRILQTVWEKVAAGHYRSDFREKYQPELTRFRPEILAAGDDAAFADAVNRLFDAIGDSHLRLMPPTSAAGTAALRAAAAPPVSAEPPTAAADARSTPAAETPAGQTAAPAPAAPEAPAADVPADPGCSVLGLDDGVAVHQVVPDSPAAAAGIRPGDLIVAIDGLAVRPDEPVSPSWSMLVRSLLTRGAPGTPVRLTLRGPDGATRDLSVVRAANGGSFFQLGVIPRLAAVYHARMLDGRTGYVRFNLFVPEVIRRFRRDLRQQFRDAEALVIDLRGNPGGILLTAEWLAAWCCRREIPLGSLILDRVPLKPVSSPQPGAFGGRLAILTDRDTGSTAELFAAAMQDAGAALVVGETTPGKCLPSQFLDIGDGFRLQSVAGNILRASGQPIERCGVAPDLPVPLRAADLAAGRDPVLERAMDALNRKR